jgi:hypothetical protein
LPCDFRATHGKDGFAVQIVAEQSLSCTPARQKLCRADFSLCRAFWLHSKAQFCRSVTSEEELHLVDVDDENTTAVSPEKTLRVSSIPWDDEERKYRRYDPYANDSYLQRRYLVVSGNQLLKVKRMINVPPVLPPLDDSGGIEKRTHWFRVFEAADLRNDGGHGRWRDVTTLAGRALFISQGCSESIPADAADAQCGSARAREDCIYFTTEDHNEYFRDTGHSAPKNPFDDSGVYHMRDQTVTSLPLEASTMSAEHEGPWSSTWIFPET